VLVLTLVTVSEESRSIARPRVPKYSSFEKLGSAPRQSDPLPTLKSYRDLKILSVVCYTHASQLQTLLVIDVVCILQTFFLVIAQDNTPPVRRFFFSRLADTWTRRKRRNLARGATPTKVSTSFFLSNGVVPLAETYKSRHDVASARLGDDTPVACFEGKKRQQ